jgi:methylated-DNA-[protein]-cysteine S-methyltransferase
MTELFIDRIDFDLGQILIVTDGQSLCAIDFSGYEQRMIKLLTRRYKSIQLVDQVNPQGFSHRISAYLAGDLNSVDGISVQTGGTVFQQQVWLALRTIPPGTTATYSELAKLIDRPKACRAVGLANSLNPIAIVLPCHRVIGANGALTGYAGGLDRKEWLLHHEQSNTGRVVRLKGLAATQLSLAGC